MNYSLSVSGQVAGDTDEAVLEAMNSLEAKARELVAELEGVDAATLYRGEAEGADLLAEAGA